MKNNPRSACFYLIIQKKGSYFQKSIILTVLRNKLIKIIKSESKQQIKICLRGVFCRTLPPKMTYLAFIKILTSIGSIYSDRPMRMEMVNTCGKLDDQMVRRYENVICTKISCSSTNTLDIYKQIYLQYSTMCFSTPVFLVSVFLYSPVICQKAIYFTYYWVRSKTGSYKVFSTN